MGWLRRKKPYDRSRLMRDAAGVRKKGKRHKAIALYREILAVEPNDPDVHRRIAPLLAETKEPAAAWESYQRAVDGLTRQGFVDQAVGVLREASERLPRQPEVWGALADVQLKRHRPVDAHQALVEGHRHFRSRSDRSHAILLLLRARKLAPRDFVTNFDLARLLAKAGARGRARSLLEEIASWSTGKQLRRVRARQFALSPTPAAAWRWLTAAWASTVPATGSTSATGGRTRA
jgi:predicted Zn-dependent protease